METKKQKKIEESEMIDLGESITDEIIEISEKTDDQYFKDLANLLKRIKK